MCECKESIDKGVCDKEFIWNPSNCKCGFDKSYDVGEYLDYSNCICIKKLVNKLVGESIKSVDEVEITELTQAENKCSSCTLCIVLFSTFFTISIVIAIEFVYSHWYLKNYHSRVMLDICTETAIS